ncbi:MAG: nickel-dependent lactate racemase [Chloroflexi bacterium]|nr:nickel-dependent lactate racemase [Chloroflexota bacterium]
MPDFRIPYGRTQLAFQIADAFHTELLAPAPLTPLDEPVAAVDDALDQPAGGVRLADFAGAESVAIAINDKTRPVPLDLLLPPLLGRLADLGVPDSAVTLFVASGAHSPMRASELPELVPPRVLSRYRIVPHDCDDRSNLVSLGTTTRGTPVWVNRQYTSAQVRIALGNLEPHQFMGFSGGVKTAAIGLGGRETLTRNHALMLDPRARLARYDDNPARQDVEEIGRMIGVHLALDAVVNENHALVHVVAGEPRAVMQVGIPIVLQLYRAAVAEPFDLVVASPGGHPKDINLYQAQKAIAHATLVTRPGGTVILAAACPDGTGSEKYDEWMVDKTSHAQVIEAFRREGFRLGPHKAYLISRDASRERVLLVTEMPQDRVRRCLLSPCRSLNDALAIALGDLGPKARIGIMPYANATIPILADAGERP